MSYVIRNRMTGQRKGVYNRYVDAFNAARAEGPAWYVVEAK